MKMLFRSKGNDMKLIEEIQDYFPIPVYPTKQLQKILRKQGLILKNAELNILEVYDSGDTGGIACKIMDENKEVLIVSLTHLKIMPDHPLSDKILAYQKQRIKRIS